MRIWFFDAIAKGGTASELKAFSRKKDAVEALQARGYVHSYGEKLRSVDIPVTAEGLLEAVEFGTCVKLTRTKL